MLIRELEVQTGLERATIRFYEKEGMITPIRQDNGYRTYSQEDRETLLKIKLLRQLGISLEDIKNIQQGSADFSDALAQQIQALEKQIRDSARAKEVCREIQSSGVGYDTLDAAYYLRELTKEQSSKSTWTPQPVPEFRQKIPFHPWKRFFARWIDDMLLHMVVLIIFTVVIRVRPFNGLVYTVLNWAITGRLLMIPVEALLLHYFGTTPGKWIFGIRVESANGGNLTLEEAMHRGWYVLRYGYGFTIPVYTIWRQYKSYKEYRDDSYTEWDNAFDSEVRFDSYYDAQKIAAISCLAVLYVLGTCVWANDMVRARHRGEDLTVAQVAQNYNDWVDFGNDGESDPTAHMTDSGHWYRSGLDNGSNIIIIDISGTPEDGTSEFVFDEENGYVRRITFDETWTDIMINSPMNSTTTLTLAVASAQDWFGFLPMFDFAQYLGDRLVEESGNITYENIQIIWYIETENCNSNGAGTYYGSDDGESKVTVHYELIIHDAQ